LNKEISDKVTLIVLFKKSFCEAIKNNEDEYIEQLIGILVQRSFYPKHPGKPTVLAVG